MKQMKVTNTGNSKNGNAYVCFDGDNTRYYVSAQIRPPTLGQIIEADTASKRFPNSKFETWFLNDYKAVPQQANGAPAVKFTPVTVSVPAGWPIDSKDCAIILEVILKAAFEADLITKPEQMAEWFDRTYAYVNGLKTGKIVGFDDRIDWPRELPQGQDAKTGLAGSIEDGEPPYTADF